METNSDFDKEKVYAYIDNFNFYHSIEEWDDVKWIDFEKLIDHIVSEIFLSRGVKREYSIEKIKYFTSKTPHRMGKECDRGKSLERQQKYWKAIRAANPKIEWFYGEFKRDKNTKILKEKKTDVKIACHILGDAHEDRYRTALKMNDAHKYKYSMALLLSADGDFIPALEWIQKKEYRKEVIVVFPPGNGNGSMELIAHDHITITKEHLEKCLLPDPVITKEGEIIKCPETWKWQTEKNE